MVRYSVRVRVYQDVELEVHADADASEDELVDLVKEQALEDGLGRVDEEWVQVKPRRSRSVSSTYV